jgi:bifunctional ADP-heptose synthase (sugar kinase/adenylyltransferase)
MEVAIEYGKILIPAALAIYAMYLTINSFLKRDFEKRLMDLKNRNSEIILPNRLQAYERMTLFLERISPGNLILRLNDPSYSAKKLQSVMINEIREELNHNLSQQVYMSDDAWKLIKNTVEELISLINEAAQELVEDAKGIDLAKNLFAKISEKNFDRIDATLTFLKQEIQLLF